MTIQSGAPHALVEAIVAERCGSAQAAVMPQAV
jgi:hypothetical protein